MTSGAVRWKKQRLRFLLTVDPPVPTSVRRETDRIASFLPMEAVGENGGLDLTREIRVSDALAGYTFVSDGDVLLSKVTPCFENGKGSLVSGLAGGVGFATTEVYALRPGPGVRAKFLDYLLQSRVFRAYGTARLTGAGGLKRLSVVDLRNFEARIPSHGEQEAISNFLDRETARIDTLIEEQQRLIELLQERRQAVITRSCAGPEDEQIQLVRCITNQVDYRGATPPKTDSGVQLITARNVKAGWIDYDSSREFVDEKSYAQVMRRGLPHINDLLFTMEAPLGNVALIDNEHVALAQRVIKWTIDKDRANPRYLLYALLSDAFQYQLRVRSTGSTALGIKASKLPELRVWLPGIEEQVRIAEFLDEQAARIDALIAESQKFVELSRERRLALITAAVTGQIDVRESA